MREVRDNFGVPARRAQHTLGEGSEERRREEGGGQIYVAGVDVCPYINTHSKPRALSHSVTLTC